MKHDSKVRPCSVCAGPDFRRCSCPWGKTFDAWPVYLRSKVQQLVACDVPYDERAR